ncbi:MAG: phospho-N-acetylmuramoyl-pentapeptide-transferase [Alphaproteobacteria bacterium]|nr:phospho-N-acetylmuramoyl-pentapeptide-transferase [Alphaproteobacteria bacterium]
MFSCFLPDCILQNCFLALVAGFVFCFIGMPHFINLMHALKQSQPIRDDGPQTHLQKQGTPTMGGVVILASVLFSTLLFAPISEGAVWLLIGVMMIMGLLGFYDDYLKLKSRSSKGVTGRQRLFAEFMTGTLAILGSIYLTPNELSTVVRIPYLTSVVIPLGIVYVAFAAVVFTGTTNAVNLTDGLDGLVSVPLMIAFFCFGLFGFISSDLELSRSFDLFYLPHVKGVCVFAAACIGALGAFLCYNKKPAKIFMGDVGALGLGAALGMIAIITRQEILLAVIGALFVIEALSDMIQVGSYKYRHKRVFLMAPIHHHFEKMGWSEVKVVRSFWAFAFIMGLIGLASLL